MGAGVDWRVSGQAGERRIRMAQGMPYHTLEVTTELTTVNARHDLERMVGHTLVHSG